MRIVSAAFVLFVSAVQASAAPPLAGTWFGVGQSWAKDGMYIDHMAPGGAFHGEYRLCRGGKALDSTQTGNWSLSGDILVIKVTAVDGHPEARTDTYRMLSHDAKTQNYVFLPDNFPFKSRRVADDYQMPSCEMIS